MSDATEHVEDPRIAHTRRVVRQAALDELADVGYGRFTIESVAQRAHVAKSTIYRHWDGRLSLIADALDALNQQPVPTPGDGTHREQIARLLRHLAEAMCDPTLSAAVPAMIEAAERDPGIARVHHRYNDRRRQTLVDVISAGIQTGEFPGRLDPELTALALAAPIVYRRLMTDQPFPQDRLDDLIDHVIGPASR